MRTKCELSGVTVTAIPHDDWVENRPYKCHACGQLVTWRLRGSDLPGQGRLHTHYITQDAAIVESLARQSEFYANNPRTDARPDTVTCVYCDHEYDPDDDGDHILCVGSGDNICGECRPEHVRGCGPCLTDLYAE
jgi:hypothetical protein